MSSWASGSSGAIPSTCCDLQSMLDEETVLKLSATEMRRGSSEKPELRLLRTSNVEAVDDMDMLRDLESLRPWPWELAVRALVAEVGVAVEELST